MSGLSKAAGPSGDHTAPAPLVALTWRLQLADA